MKTLKLSLISVLLVGIFIHHAEAVSRLVLGSDARMMRTIIVSPGESETDGGTTLLNALASVTGTIDSPYLIKIEPGHYDLGDVSLVMKPYIDIEGSGQAATVISSSCSQGVILGSSPCELRELTVVNTYDGAAAAYGISTNGYSPVIRNVTVDISRGCSYPTGIYNNVAGTVLSGVTVPATLLKIPVG